MRRIDFSILLMTALVAPKGVGLTPEQIQAWLPRRRGPKKSIATISNGMIRLFGAGLIDEWGAVTGAGAHAIQMTVARPGIVTPSAWKFEALTGIKNDGSRSPLTRAVLPTAPEIRENAYDNGLDDLIDALDELLRGCHD